MLLYYHWRMSYNKTDFSYNDIISYFFVYYFDIHISTQTSVNVNIYYELEGHARLEKNSEMRKIF